jgi:hypothetical protein
VHYFSDNVDDDFVNFPMTLKLTYSIKIILYRLNCLTAKLTVNHVTQRLSLQIEKT